MSERKEAGSGAGVRKMYGCVRHHGVVVAGEGGRENRIHERRSDRSLAVGWSGSVYSCAATK